MLKLQVKEDMEPAELKSVVKMEESKKIRMKETISKNDLSTGLLLDHTYCAAIHPIVPLRLNAGDHTYSGTGNCINNYTNIINQSSQLANIKIEIERLPPDSLPVSAQQSEANIFMLQLRSQKGEKSGSSNLSNLDVKIENDNMDCLVECGLNEKMVVDRKFDSEDEESTETSNDEDGDSLPAGDTEYSPDEDLNSDLQYSTGTDIDESIRKRSHANHSLYPASLASTLKAGFQADSLISMKMQTKDCKNKATFACCLCQVICENKDVLLKHIAKDHPAAKFICAYCLNIFSKEDTFRYHVCSRPTSYMSFLPDIPFTQVPVVPLSDPEKQCSISRSSQRLLPTPILGTNCNTIKMITLPKTFNKVSKTPLPNQCDPPLSLTTFKSTNTHTSPQISQFHNNTNNFNQGSHLPNIKTENKRLPLDSLPESEANIFTHHQGIWRGENVGSSIMSNQHVKVENDKEYGLLECGPNEEEVVEGEYEITEDGESTETNNEEDSDSLPAGDTEYSPDEDLSSDSQYSTGTNNDESIRKRSQANYCMDPESLTSRGKVGFQADSLVSIETRMEDCKNKATFACCLCQVICENKDVLLKHIAKDHPAAKFICAYCLNIFSKEDTFRYHVCSRPTGYMSFLPDTPFTQVPVVPLSDPEKQRSINRSSQRLLPTPILGTNCNTIKMITLPKTFDKVSKTPISNQCSPLSSTPAMSTNAHSSQQILQFQNYTNTFNQGSRLPNIKTENERLPLDSLPESEANIFTHHPGTWRGENSGSSILSNQHVKVENDNEDGLVECGPYEEVVVDGEFKMTVDKESTKSGTEADSDSLPPGNTVYHAGEDFSSDSQYSTGSNNDESIKKIFHANYSMNPEIFTSTAKVNFQADSSICCNGKLVNMEKHMKDCKNNPTFACCLCQMVCENEGLLLKHTAEDHPSAIFICAYCLNMFSKEDTFRNHVCSRLTGYARFLPATPVTPVPVVPSVCLSDPAKQLSTKRTPPSAPILGTNCTTIRMINSTKTFNKVSMTPLPNQSGPHLSLNTLTSTNAHSTQISEVVLPIKPVATLSQTVDQTKMVLLQTTALTQAKIVRDISPLSPAKLNPQVQANRNKPRLDLKQTPAANVRPLQLPAKAPLATPVSCPTMVSTIVQNNQPQIPLQTSPVQIQIPTPAPLEIVAMFLNQSKDLPLKKQFQQSWRSKTIFPCRQCGAISRQLSLRVRHRYLHQGSRLYRCQCGKSFQRQLHLLRHQVQHAESVRFVCARCGNTFDGAHKLTLHKQRLHRKHKTTNGRQYAKKKCTAAFDCICGQEFARPSALLWHMLKNAKPLKHKHKIDSGLN
ncbi:uncharacterized protein LOC127452415 isoform X2 [Myxocyprinus asiaticus]|uniref:uncharacterized protein LOC127452415 isoform X2 n=1 Tax=Myxocyprinus asiaticus TaxID=70543 RepID=UPI002223C4B2|nr:uncharacterized protein LOC127452415 isoform X2 [Myxocyprinus asiaticus]